MKPRRVLVIDDCAEDRAVVRRYLQKMDPAGYQLLECERGAAAVRCVLDAMPDVVLLDYYLPDSDGLTVLKAIKAEPRLHSIPVVLMTGGTGGEIAADALLAGAQDYLEKDAIVPAALRLVIENAIVKQRLTAALEARTAEAERARAEADRHASRIQIVAGLSRALAQLQPDVQKLAAAAAERLAQDFADGCIVRLRGARPAFAHADPEALDVLREALRTPPEGAPWGPDPGDNIQAVFIPRVTPEMLDRLPPAVAAAARRLGLHSYMAVPIRGLTGTPGVIVLWRDRTPEPFEEDDLGIIQVCAEHIWLAAGQAERLAALRGEERPPACA